MKRSFITAVAAIAVAMVLIAAPAFAAEVDVEITNLTSGIYFTPFLVSAHDSSTHMFEHGVAASASLEIMAECGDISSLSSDLGGADDDTVENPASGLLAPGASTTAMINTTSTGNTHLSIVAMLLPTNDGFVGLDALEIPATPGTYTYYLNGYDAGTEANTEVINTATCDETVSGIPADPGGDAGSGGSAVSGADDNTTVHVHRGNLGGSGGDLDPTIHRWLNPVAKIVLTVK